MEHIDFDTAADLGTLQQKYGSEIGMQVFQYYGSRLDVAAADALDETLMTEFDSYLGPTRENQPSQLPVRQPTHKPNTLTASKTNNTANATVTNSTERSSVQQHKRPQGRSNIARSDNASATTVPTRTVTKTERSVNATNVRSTTGSVNATRSEEQQTEYHATNISVGGGTEQDVRRVAEAQVQQECGLAAAPVDTGYRHLYELEVSRRTANIVRNQERRLRRRQNRTAGRAESDTHPIARQNTKSRPIPNFSVRSS